MNKWQYPTPPTEQIRIPDGATITDVKYGTRETSTLFWDEGSGPLWIVYNSISWDGIIRADTLQGAMEAAIDEVLPDGEEPIDDNGKPLAEDSHEYACWCAANTYRSGVPANTGISAPIAALDLNGWGIRPLTGEEVDHLGIVIDCDVA